MTESVPHLSDAFHPGPRPSDSSDPLTAALSQRPLLFDGAACTFLQARGLAPG